MKVIRLFENRQSTQLRKRSNEILAGKVVVIFFEMQVIPKLYFEDIRAADRDRFLLLRLRGRQL
jgi:hypothetical protein